MFTSFILYQICLEYRLLYDDNTLTRLITDRVVDLIITGSDNGLSPGRHQTIISTNAGILLIGPLGTNVDEIVFKTRKFSFKKINLNMSSVAWQLFCLGLNVLNEKWYTCS